MEQELNCYNCNEEIVITINNLFFSEEPEASEVKCPCCQVEVENIETDGWLFIRTKKEFLKEELIEKSKEQYIFIHHPI